MEELHQSDQLLVSLVLSGSPQAEAELVTRYLPLIRHKAAGYTLPGMELDDIVQEGFLGFIRAIRLYDSTKSQFSTFASICITSSMATAAKSALSQKGLPLRNYLPLDGDELSASLQDAVQSPEGQLADSEQAAALLRRIDTTLSLMEQQVLRLYLTGHSYQAISAKLSISPKTVDNALQRVRRKLRSTE
ncbi:MAG: sigma-70 family RNA polymerase sigma factor [Angelakisella sp.]